MKIGRFDLEKDILIVAEIGNNHEGSFTLAERLIGLAAQAGAGAVKFQTIIPENLITIKNKIRVKQLKKFKLSFKEFECLSKVARKENTLFLSTPFDLECARFLNGIVPAFKIASGDNNFYPLIEYICGTGKPILISSGLADRGQIKKTKDFIESIWNRQGIRQELAILHCVSKYPTPLAEANLLAIPELKKLNVTVGYSDHTVGIDAAILSAALGTRIIEKHFTIDKNYSDYGDHQLSADPKEFALMVRKIKETIKMLGDGNISCHVRQHADANNIRRSIVASRRLKKGSVLSWEDLKWVRPGGGLSPGSEKELLGKILKRSVHEGEMLLNDDVHRNSKG